MNVKRYVKKVMAILAICAIAMGVIPAVQLKAAEEVPFYPISSKSWGGYLGHLIIGADEAVYVYNRFTNQLESLSTFVSNSTNNAVLKGIVQIVGPVDYVYYGLTDAGIVYKWGGWGESENFKPISGLGRVLQLGLSDNAAYALDESGTVWCIGYSGGIGGVPWKGSHKTIYDSNGTEQSVISSPDWYDTQFSGEPVKVEGLPKIKALPSDTYSLVRTKDMNASLETILQDKRADMAMHEHHRGISFCYALDEQDNIWVWDVEDNDLGPISTSTGQMAKYSTIYEMTPKKISIKAVSYNRGRRYSYLNDSITISLNFQRGFFLPYGTQVKYTQNKEEVVIYQDGEFYILPDGTLYFYMTDDGKAIPVQNANGSGNFKVKLPGDATSVTTTTTAAPPETATEQQPISTGVKLSWEPSDNPEGYNIYRSTSESEKGEKINDQPVHGGEYIDVNAESNTTYYYTIYEINKDDSGNVTEKIVGEQFEAVTGELLEGLEEIEGKRGFILMEIGKNTMNVNGTVLEIDPGRGTEPVISDGRTLLPIRAAIEAMGGSVGWDAEESKVSISALKHNVEMRIGSKDMSADGESKEMDIAPEIMNERTMLPLRFVAENIGCQIEWIGSTKQIVIVYPMGE